MTYPQNGYAPQQGYAPQGAPQGGYAPQQGGYPQQGQGNGNGNNNSGAGNYGHITIVGHLAKDPESKMVGNSKVASSKIAFNHKSEKAGTDYWFLEVWGNEGADSKHNFLVNHCPKGRKVMVTGVPELRQSKDNNGNYNYYPTIKVTEIVALDSANKNGSNNQGGQAPQQGFNQAPPQGNFQQPQGNFQQPQQGFAPPQGAPAQGFAPPQGAPGGFPPNVPGAGYAPVGAPVGAPQGGFPQQ